MTEDRTRCEETVAAVHEYVAGTLDPQRVAAFEAHVAVCEACHVALEEAQEAVASGDEEPRDVLQSVATSELPDENNTEERTHTSGRFKVFVAIVVMFLALISLVMTVMPAFQRPHNRVRYSAANTLKQWGIIMKMYANESPGELFPPLSPYEGAWSPDTKSTYPEYWGNSNIRGLVNPRHPDAAEMTEKMTVALTQEIVDYEAVSRIVGKNFVYFGYVVRNLPEFQQFVQGIAAYAPAQRENGIPTHEGGLLPRLREGVENFYVTDVNDAEAVAQTAAAIPIMFEIPYPEGDPRHQDVCYVLYLDGHVAALPYGDRFPALPEVAAIMQAAGALK